MTSISADTLLLLLFINFTLFKVDFEMPHEYHMSSTIVKDLYYLRGATWGKEKLMCSSWRSWWYNLSDRVILVHSYLLVLVLGFYWPQIYTSTHNPNSHITEYCLTLIRTLSSFLLTQCWQHIKWLWTCVKLVWNPSVQSQESVLTCNCKFEVQRSTLMSTIFTWTTGLLDLWVHYADPDTGTSNLNLCSLRQSSPTPAIQSGSKPLAPNITTSMQFSQNFVKDWLTIMIFSNSSKSIWYSWSEIYITSYCYNINRLQCLKLTKPFIFEIHVLKMLHASSKFESFWKPTVLNQDYIKLRHSRRFLMLKLAPQPIGLLQPGSIDPLQDSKQGVPDIPLDPSRASVLDDISICHCAIALWNLGTY